MNKQLYRGRPSQGLKARKYWKYLRAKLKAESYELVSATNQLNLLAQDVKRQLIDTLDVYLDVEIVEMPLLKVDSHDSP